MKLQKWHRVTATLGHQGAGRAIEIELYFFGADAMEVFKKYKRLGGIHRGDTPKIRALEEDEASLLEKEILERDIALDTAKKRGYSPSREYRIS